MGGYAGVVSLAAALSIPVYLHPGQAFPQRNLILFITFAVILITLVLQGLTLPALIKWVNMEDPDYTVPYPQQRQLVRKKLAHLSLGILNDKYPAMVQENDMLKALKLKIEGDMVLLKDWSEDDNDSRSAVFYHDYKMVMADLLHEQRKLLAQLNKKAEVDESIIRHQLALLDLEEEKLRQHFSYGEE
jgi:hypothetical protein